MYKAIADNKNDNSTFTMSYAPFKYNFRRHVKNYCIFQNINAADLLSTHVTGVISHGHNGFQTFVDIKEFPHDPNLTINVLLLMLKRTADANVSLLF